MATFLKLVPLMVTSIISLLTSPLFWMIVILVGFQYKRMARNKSYQFNLPEEPVWRPTLIAAFFGLGGGIIGSFLMILVGVSVLEVGVNYLWLTAIALMFIQQRFLCFAYAGGVLSLAKLIFGVPELSIPQLMALVAILHMVESILILFSGHLGAVPAYIKAHDGRVVGGYNLQKFWPLPLVALAAWIYPNTEALQGAVHMPDWWPLIKPELLRGSGETVYMMMPVVAALGYGDIALTALPKDKTYRSALELAGYSLILLTLAITASYYPALAFLPALFGPFGHEFLIYVGQKRELRGKPAFVPPERGIMILDTLQDSPLKKAGVKPGDILLSLNGIPVNSEYQVETLLLDAGKVVEIEYLSGKRRSFRRALVNRGFGKPLGFIPVPNWYEHSYMEVTGSVSFLKGLWQRLINRISYKKRP